MSFWIYRDVFRIYDVFFPAPTLTIYPSFNNDAKATSIVDMLISGNFSDIIFFESLCRVVSNSARIRSGLDNVRFSISSTRIEKSL